MIARVSLLSDADLRTCRNALLSIQRQRELGRQSPIEGFARTLNALEEALSATASGSDHVAMEHNWITTQQMAELIGCSTRRVRQIATELGGEKLGRDWRFPA